MKSFGLAIAILLLITVVSVQSDDDLGQTQIYFIPSYAAPDPNNGPDAWSVRLSGIVYQSEGGTAKIPSDYADALNDLQNSQDLTQQQRYNIGNRTAPFTYEHVQNYAVIVTFPSGQNYTLNPTGSDGSFEQFVQGVTITNVGTERPRLVNYTATTENGTFTGYAVLGEAEGQTVSSDFDDVLRITRIWNLPEAIRRSFADEYEQVPGIAQVLDGWEQNLENPLFNYLTTTPIPLAEIYSPWVNSNFPVGSLDFRPLDLTDPTEILNARTKALEQYAQAFPARRFIIVGDVSTLDQLSVFPGFYDQFPNQTQCILCVTYLPKNQLTKGFLHRNRFRSRSVTFLHRTGGFTTIRVS